jgi:hypothetical protein
MHLEKVLQAMREGKIVKSKSASYGLKLKYEAFGCIDENDKVMIAKVDNSGKIFCYCSLEAEDLLKADYEII